MAHELSTENGKAAMMYVGQVPWHGLGQKLDKPATSAEAIKAAHLDWEVAKVPLYLKGSNGYRLADETFAIVRSDVSHPAPLGIVGTSYQPLQNRAAFVWFDEIVGQDAAIYHTAGALGSGERVWILAKLPGEIRVKGDDIAEKFLLLSNSHDGKSSVQVKFSAALKDRSASPCAAQFYFARVMRTSGVYTTRTNRSPRPPRGFGSPSLSMRITSPRATPGEIWTRTKFPVTPRTDSDPP